MADVGNTEFPRPIWENNTLSPRQRIWGCSLGVKATWQEFWIWTPLSSKHRVASTTHQKRGWGHRALGIIARKDCCSFGHQEKLRTGRFNPSHEVNPGDILARLLSSRCSCPVLLDYKMFCTDLMVTDKDKLISNSRFSEGLAQCPRCRWNSVKARWETEEVFEIGWLQQVNKFTQMCCSL